MKQKKILFGLFLKNPLAGVVALLQAIRRATLFDYRFFNNGFSFYLATIVFHPTARCNLNCKMCVISSYAFPKELSLVEVKNIIDQIAFFKPHFYIAGGEPLLRKDLEQIIAYAKKRGLITTFTTNGILLNSKRARSLIKSGVDGIAVSIDGPKMINDQIRGKGNFEKAVAAIRGIQEIRQKNKQVFPKLKIATVISGFSYRYLEDMVKLAGDLKIEEIVFFHLDYKTQKIAKTHQDCMIRHFNQPIGCLGYVVKDELSLEEKKFVDIQPGILKQQIQKIYSQKHSVSISFAPPVPFAKINDYYSGKYFKDFVCTNPWFSATILPNGDLVPCFSLKMGNLMKKDFRNLWNSGLYKKFRRYLLENGHFPGCFHCCGTSDI